ncbi:hypothetical protein [Noviherbaspirillum autotrophicum]|uniref:Uncharacterized protein n=1 Tax=Noviherbaspirillum autotrophicum TaxID=709839 RepID=A0A0C2BZL0_9BURK|nr:hypothetical protein [Noviherbaspirillum autotrophicum]KIF83471.1 hypothetical protein TSA66_03530 [Noviherbaspirillum autotrophicum]
MPKKTYLVVAAAVALALLLNPSPDRHRTTITQAMAERSPLAGVLGIGAVTAFVSTYHSLGVASYTEVDGRLITLGAFGGVFLVH